MTNTLVQTPFVPILGLNGTGLNGGKVYIGVVDQDPQTDPQAVFWDQAGTIPASQPLDVMGGYVMHLGSPAQAWTGPTYSMRVRDRLGNQVFYEENVQTALDLKLNVDGSNIGSNGAAFRAATGTDQSQNSFFLQAGTSPSQRTSRDKMRDNIAVLDWAAPTDGTDASVAIQRAIDQAFSLGGGVVHGVKGATYSLSSTVEIKAGVTLDLEGATLKAVTGATLVQILQISSNNARVRNGTLDGTGMVAPTAAYSFASSPGTGIYITTATGGNLTGIRISGMAFSNFPSGAVLVGGAAGAVNLATGLIIEDCSASNVQTYTANETPAVFHFQAVTASYQLSSIIIGYAWKGFYTGNGAFCQIEGCYAYGGSIGNASHYISGGNDNSILDGSHENVGFGFKLFNTVRATVKNFKSKTAQAAGLVEGATDFVLDGITCLDPVVQAVGVQGLAGVTTNGSILNVVASRTTPGSTTNHVGIFFRAFSTGPIDGLYIQNPILTNFYTGILGQNTNSDAQKNVTISGGSIANSVQLGVSLFVQSGGISGTKFTRATPNAFAHVFFSNVATLPGQQFTVENCVFYGATGNNIELAVGGGVVDYDLVTIRGNRGSGGTNAFNGALNNSTTDRIGQLSILDNAISALTGNGNFINFNTTTSVMFRSQNSYLDASNVPIVDAYANTANVTIAGNFSYIGSPNTQFKAYVGRVQYWRTDGGAGTSLYTKESGVGTNTGWVGK